MEISSPHWAHDHPAGHPSWPICALMYAHLLVFYEISHLQTRKILIHMYLMPRDCPGGSETQNLKAWSNKFKLQGLAIWNIWCHMKGNPVCLYMSLCHSPWRCALCSSSSYFVAAPDSSLDCWSCLRRCLELHAMSIRPAKINITTRLQDIAMAATSRGSRPPVGNEAATEWNGVWYFIWLSMG